MNEKLNFLYCAYASYRQNVGHLNLSEACEMYEEQYGYDPKELDSYDKLKEIATTMWGKDYGRGD